MNKQTAFEGQVALDPRKWEKTKMSIPEKI
jgi:hypothetical protein